MRRFFGRHITYKQSEDAGTMIKNSLIELAESKDIIYVVVASTDGEHSESYGDINKLKYNSIVKELFGDKKSIQNLNQSLEGMMMPRTWGQGIVNGVICKPQNNILIGLFYHESNDATSEFRFASELNEHANNIWNS